MSDIVFATCRAAPEIQASDRLVAKALSARGVTVEGAPWNGDQAPFRDADLIVIRSTWDYPAAAAEFREWLNGFGDDRRVVNPPALMGWNIAKDYLLELGSAGAPVGVLGSVDPTAEAIGETMDQLGLAEGVVKPVIGASGIGVSIVRRDDPNSLDRAAAKLGMRGLIQPFLPEIQTKGEISLIFIDGCFTHAVVKRPAVGEILCQEEHGGVTTSYNPPEKLVDFGREVVASLQDAPIYARVDVIVLDAGPQLMELELIEPELFLTHAPKSAEVFAAALADRLN